MTPTEFDRMLIMFYRSNNAHDYTNFTRKAGWLDELPMTGLQEFLSLLEATQRDVKAEIQDRLDSGMPRYSRAYHRGDYGNCSEFEAKRRS